MIEDLAARNPDGKMVLHVDEYDKPLLGRLGKSDVNEIRDALKAFYSVIKTCEGLQRFAFITGVSKFSKVSIFDCPLLAGITISGGRTITDWTVDGKGWWHASVEPGTRST